MRNTIQVDAFVVMMLANNFIGLVAGTEVLPKIIDRGSIQN
jgi:hypothetical protein